MNNPDVDTMLELHRRKVRVERAKTEALTWFLRLFGGAALLFVLWHTISPVSDEERFYSEACKQDAAELPPSVRSTCAAIKALESG